MKLALAWAANLLRTPLDAELAQLVEQCFRKAWVICSNPMLGSIFKSQILGTGGSERGREVQLSEMRSSESRP